MKKLIKKYIDKTNQAFSQIEMKNLPLLKKTDISKVIDHAKRYAEDAGFYFRTNKLETALASICYSEGLLDALKLLQFVNFEWE